MQWWCSAQTAAWDWGWQAYPGVWLFVGVLAAVYFRLRGRAKERPAAARGSASGTPPAGSLRGRTGWAAAGFALLWITLDWPVGPLGASYMASVHMAQVLTLSLVVPALLLLGLPRSAFRGLRNRPALRRFLEVVTHPVVALVVYNGIVVGTHVPGVLDTLSATQLGMLTMDLLWLAAGLVFWWPVLAPVPERPWFGWFFKMGYLFLNTVPATVPYSFLVFADLPLYATYELAPPIPGVDPVTDQQVAGLLMKFGGGSILWSSITVLFFRWYRVEGAGDEEGAGGEAAPATGARDGCFG